MSIQWESLLMHFTGIHDECYQSIRETVTVELAINCLRMQETLMLTQLVTTIIDDEATDIIDSLKFSGRRRPFSGPPYKVFKRCWYFYKIESETFRAIRKFHSYSELNYTAEYSVWDEIGFSILREAQENILYDD